jgi:hypothetical protein
MKRVTLGFSALALSAAFVYSCKPKPAVAPEADTEVESAVYASYANYLISDIDMACTFLGDNSYTKTFYSLYPGSSGTVTAVRDTSGSEDQLVMAWNKTRCMDGNVRDGSIFMNAKQLPNQRYARDPRWEGRIRFENYQVNGWNIQLWDSVNPMYLKNTLTDFGYNPLVTNITWEISGKVKIIHPTDPNKNMVWEGRLYKTLDNTKEKDVFDPRKQSSINWFKAHASYYGKFEGSGPQIDEDGKVTPNVRYAMEIHKEAPLKRDFTCSPDKVSGIAFTNTVGVIELRADEHHPFIQGVASFSVGSAYPRQIYYGNEGDSRLPSQCDNVGEVLIKGMSYRIDFMK